MIIRDHVATETPTHILVKYRDEPIVAFSIEYPDGHIIDEIDCTWVNVEENGWLREADEPTHEWCVTFFAMGDRNYLTHVRIACLDFPEMTPDRPGIMDDDDDEVVILTDITEAEYETLHALADVPLYQVYIDENGVEDVSYPDEHLRTSGQEAEIEGRKNMTYDELLGL